MRLYARRVGSSPPVIVQGADTKELEAEQDRAELRIRVYGTNWPQLRQELTPAS